MKYWTVQDLPAWEEAKRIGYLTGNKEYIMGGGEEWVECYDWMVKQMKERLELTHDFYPVWLWDKRPDLRQRRYASKGKQAVLLEAELDPATVLLSDYESWHCVLNMYPLQLHEDEEIDMEKSWERVFDLDLLTSSPQWFGSVTVQVTVPEIPINKLKVLRIFTGR